MFDNRAIIQKQKLAKRIGISSHCKAAINDIIDEQLSLQNRIYQTCLIHGLYQPDCLQRLAKKIVYHDDIAINKSSDRYDIITSILYLHTIEDIDSLVMQYKQSLNDNGLLALFFFGGDTFFQLQRSIAKVDERLLNGAAPRILPKIAVKDAARIINKAGFANPVSISSKFVVRYDNINKFIVDIKGLMLGNTLIKRSNKPLPKVYFYELEQALLDDAIHSESAGNYFEISYDLISAFGYSKLI